MEVFIVDINKTTSIHHNGMIYEVIFMDFAGNTYNSYIDPKMKNFGNWEYIIRKFFSNNHGFVLTNIHKRKNTQLDADSIPRIVVESDNHDDMLDIINEEIEFDPRKAIFKRLFDI